MRSNVSLITGVTRKIELQRAVQNHVALKQYLLDGIGIKSAPSMSVIDVPIQYKFDYSPSLREFNEMVKSFDSADRSINQWDDVGFKFPANNKYGLSGIEWLSGCYANSKISLDLKWIVPDQLLNMASLINAIERSRATLLASITSQEEHDEAKSKDESSATATATNEVRM
jgi:hypothetical protein